MSRGIDKAMASISISYAREDRGNRKDARPSARGPGWSVWWDRRIPTGRRFDNDNVIAEELALARGVIVLWSSHGVLPSWVREEAADARDRSVLAAPVLVGAVHPPLGFRGLQAADLATC